MSPTEWYRAAFRRPAAGCTIGQCMSNAGSVSQPRRKALRRRRAAPTTADAAGVSNDQNDARAARGQHRHVARELDGIAQSLVEQDEDGLAFDRLPRRATSAGRISDRRRQRGVSTAPRVRPSRPRNCRSANECSDKFQSASALLGSMRLRRDRRSRKPHRTGEFAPAQMALLLSAATRSGCSCKRPVEPSAAPLRRRPSDCSAAPILLQMSALPGSSACARRLSASASSNRFRPRSASAAHLQRRGMVGPQLVAQVEMRERLLEPPQIVEQNPAACWPRPNGAGRA